MSYILENSFVKLTIDEKNGGIAGLENKRTGWQLIQRPALEEGMQLLVPFGKYRNNKVLSSQQTPPDVKKLGENALLLTWDGVTGSKSGPLDIKVEVKAALEREEVRFDMTIDNRSAYYVEEAWCPCLNGIDKPEGEEDLTSMMLGMCCDANRLVLGDGFPQGCGYWGTDNPTVLKTFPGPDGITPFDLLTNGRQGLYVGVHDVEPNLVNFVHQLKPGYSGSMGGQVRRADAMGGYPAGFTVGVARMPYVMPGEKKTLPPVVLTFFEGDWHQGVKPYMKWRDGWFKRVETPAWSKDVDCWMTLHINSPEGCCRYRYTELPDVIREAKKYGVQALQLIGWAIGGQDGNEPFQDTDPLLGTREELKEAIRQIEEMGVRVLLMCKFKWADWEVSEYEEHHIEDYALKDIYGKPFQFGGYTYQTLAQQMGSTVRSGVGMYHQSSAYRAFALSEFKKIVDLGPSGILYDELANHMRLCYDPNHDHPFGACNHVGSVKLAEEFYDYAVSQNPDFLMTGEGPLDVFTRYYTINYIRSASYDHQPVQKYMDPDMGFATCLTGFDDREMVNQCLTYGYIINYEPFNFKGRMTDVPETAAYGQKAQALRRKLWDYIWKGKFLHTDSVSVESLSGVSNFIYSAFENRENGKKALVISNQDPREALCVNAAIDGAGRGCKAYTPEGDEFATDGQNVTVPARSLVVLVEE